MDGGSLRPGVNVGKCGEKSCYGTAVFCGGKGMSYGILARKSRLWLYWRTGRCAGLPDWGMPCWM